MIKRIFIGCDHGGFELKEKIMQKYGHSNVFFDKNGKTKADSFTFIDCGAFALDQNDDFPDFVSAVCSEIKKDKNAFGILICGTGIGVSIIANRNKYIRAALCHSTTYAKFARFHNNANVLCLGGRFVDFNTACRIIEVFFKTESSPDLKYKKRMEG
ncbi:MAG: RpiB/LacA/LacB family sugar-phosphate isomerase [Christensenellaceae bacterium]|jgi:ribose 5-phosphate isomerase B|nr:RpiB/LacA/LacB family sugar-phosphate isomerase [Christensenellaceae bacterium]